MHIDRANNVSVSSETAFLAIPFSAFRLVSVPTYRTLATCSSFRASEAHDVGHFGFVGEIVNILAIFPQGHALIVVPSAIAVANPMRIPDEE
jgi:hypothetical protein